MIAKAEENTDFRRRLVANPNSALNEAFDVEVPDDFNVVVSQDDTRTTHLVLPASAELSDAQLLQAGGMHRGRTQIYGVNPSDHLTTPQRSLLRN